MKIDWITLGPLALGGLGLVVTVALRWLDIKENRARFVFETYRALRFRRQQELYTSLSRVRDEIEASTGAMSDPKRMPSSTVLNKLRRVIRQNEILFTDGELDVLSTLWGDVKSYAYSVSDAKSEGKAISEKTKKELLSSIDKRREYVRRMIRSELPKSKGRKARRPDRRSYSLPFEP